MVLKKFKLIMNKRKLTHPKVPITLVSTPVSPSGCHRANPKSPTLNDINNKKINTSSLKLKRKVLARY
jgi:hypothetical protein